MSDAPDFQDPFERWNQAWFAAPLALDFRVRAGGSAQSSVLSPQTEPPATEHCALRTAHSLLRPVCLGHLIYFQALGSPLLHLGHADFEIGIPDFLAAIRILRDARWPFTAEIDFGPEPADELLLTAHTSAKFAGQPSPIEQALNEQFVPWWLRCQTVPELLNNTDSAGRSLTAPFALTMAVRLLRTGSFTEERIYSMPLSLLRFYAAAIAEQDGCGTSFMTPELAAAMKKAAERPDISKFTEQEQHALVVKLHGPAFAERWLARRRDYQRVLAERGKAFADAWVRGKGMWQGKPKTREPKPDKRRKR